jgi:butyrate kinase
MQLCGTDDVRKIRGELIPAGDKRAKLALEAMEYTMVKWAAMMAGALRGQVDAILMTGGLANDKVLVEQLTKDLSWIAPVYVYPGSFETEALASGAIRVLSGAEEVKEYTGKPVWNGFDFD